MLHTRRGCSVNTLARLHAGGSVALNGRTDVFVESSLMRSGLEPSHSYAETIGPPFLVEVGARAVF